MRASSLPHISCTTSCQLPTKSRNRAVCGMPTLAHMQATSIPVPLQQTEIDNVHNVGRQLNGTLSCICCTSGALNDAGVGISQRNCPLRHNPYANSMTTVPIPLGVAAI
eukprot:GHRR01016031.1.p1 GENE.GHRR01016031.1~~GHRR01016031.1.p1  ORF type:complete len:109 (-),score=25.18 GHRR01016031.1:959-1285(-)